ncbi:hypothetical protein ACFW04_006557 [Cataglyphis niger]
MSSFVEQPLFGREIAIPAKLPMILKQFCKAAIRTQPHDLLKWSGSYFRALADGEEPPVKSRLEYPPPSTASGLTLGFLRVLLRQFGSSILRPLHVKKFYKLHREVTGQEKEIIERGTIEEKRKIMKMKEGMKRGRRGSIRNIEEISRKRVSIGKGGKKAKKGRERREEQEKVEDSFLECKKGKNKDKDFCRALRIGIWRKEEIEREEGGNANKNLKKHKRGKKERRGRG